MISCSVVPPMGGWYSVLKVRVRVAHDGIFCNSKFLSQIKKNAFIVLYEILYISTSFLDNCVAFCFQPFLLCFYTAGIFCVQFSVCL